MSFKKICICLILIFCIIGAASAAEDVSTDVVDASADAVAVDAVSEDVSDSVESIDDEVEPAVVESASAQEENDDVELEASVDEEPALEEIVEGDSGQSPKLTDDNDEIYVVIDDPSDPDEIFMAFRRALRNVNEYGIVYLPDAVYNDVSVETLQKNFTIIGLNKEKTIFSVSDLPYLIINGNPGNYLHYLTIFNNITFISPIAIDDDNAFINCTFINSNITIGGGIYNSYIGAPENFQNDLSYSINFTDCSFINTTMDDFINVYRFSQINFINCTFENITANSIVNNKEGFTLQDGIFFSDCTFNNVNVKGIVDVPTGTIIGTEDDSRVRIEGCTGVESSGVVTEGGRDFINSTQSRLGTVLACDIDSENNFVVTLKDSEGNPVSGPISITINDGEVIPYDVDDGAFTIPFDELIGDLTGKVTIKAIFADTDSLVGSSDELSTLVVVKTETVEVPVAINPAATTIDANALTATAKVAKTLSVTLKDASGKAIANKTITYSINGVTKTAKTDANGIVKIAVNQANAGTYYYSICFLGDNDYKSAFKTVKVTVNKQATKAVFKAKTFKVKATKKVSFTLKDASGKAIKGKKITFKVGKKTYTAKTNAKGVATVKVKLTKKGKYTVTAKFAGDSTYKAITKKAKITVK